MSFYFVGTVILFCFKSLFCLNCNFILLELSFYFAQTVISFGSHFHLILFEMSLFCSNCHFILFERSVNFVHTILCLVSIFLKLSYFVQTVILWLVSNTLDQSDCFLWAVILFFKLTFLFELSFHLVRTHLFSVKCHFIFLEMSFYFVRTVIWFCLKCQFILFKQSSFCLN